MTRQLVTIALAFTCAIRSLAGTVPAELPKPDNNPGDMTKPVKVYLLAGQSNMVGFGTLEGARPTYPSIFLSADPGIKAGRMPVGPSALLPHGIYQSDAANAAPGAILTIYPGAYNPETDYAALKPLRQTTVALGTVKAELPTTDQPATLVAKAFIDVPMTGAYEIHVGFEDSTFAVAKLDGQEVYRRNPGETASVSKVALEQGKRLPLTITYMKGGSAALWLKMVDLAGKGDLTSLTAQGKYNWFVDEKGAWTVRNDVTYWDVRLSKEELGSGGPLSTTSNGKFIGPEVPFGYVMGTYHDAHVLLIESSIGNRSLSWDYRPPSSGHTDPGNKYEGYEYRHLVEGARRTLDNLDKVVPGYQGQGYEIAGFVWWQGHKDSGSTKQEYEQHLVNLIQDLRKEFDAPDMRVAVATVGFDGDKLLEGSWKGVWEAQMAVSDPEQHPELADKVASVDTRGFWRSRGESPTGTGYHYNHNAETYVLTGDSLGRAMVELLGGKAEPLQIPPPPAQSPEVAHIFSDEATAAYNKTGTNYDPAYYREMGQALKPIIFEEMVPGFIDDAMNPQSRSTLANIVTGEKPAKLPLDIQGPLDTLIRYYEVGGEDAYSWKPFAPGMRNATWSYFSFDPPEKQPLEKSNRYRAITFPKGMENWYAIEFDPAGAGWRQGQAPFGQWDGKLLPLRPSCDTPYCGCSEAPATLWEKEVLLMRQTFELPPIQDGHAYRLILGGAGCDRTGEGFAIYVNGKLLAQQDGGFFRHPGVRGAYVYDDLLPELKSGKVTIAVISFLRYTHFNNTTTYFGPKTYYRGKTVPPNGHLSVWMETAKLPPELLQAAP